MQNLESSVSSIITKLEKVLSTSPPSESTFRPVKIIAEKLIRSLREKKPSTFDLLDELEQTNINTKELADINKAISLGETEKAILLLQNKLDNIRT